MKSKYWQIFGLIIFLIGFGLFFKTQRDKDAKTQKMKIGEVEIKYELARTNEEIARGLSYRDSIPEGQGMLFVFETKGLRSFWMHEMRFPLDIIWMADNKVVQIDKNVPIKTNGAWTVVNPNYPVDKVLEMKGGEVERLKIESGQKINVDI